jgi:hypothetical protein
VTAAAQHPGVDYYDTCFDNVVEEKVVWLAPGLLAEGNITVLDGDPGKGKTTIHIDWGARISTGQPLPGGKPMDPAGYLVLNGEDTVANTLKPRARIHGADMKHMHALDSMLDGSALLLDQPNCLALLESLIKIHEIKLVVVDPVYSFMSADMTKSQQVRQALLNFQAMIRRNRVAALFLRHYNKNSQSSQSMYRGEGSIAINAVARVVLGSGDHPTRLGDRALATVKNNLGPNAPTFTYRIEAVPGEQHGKLSWIDTDNSVSADDLLGQTNRHDLEERDDIWLWAEPLVTGAGIMVKEFEKLCRDAGINLNLAKDVLKTHGVKAKPTGQGKPMAYKKKPTLSEAGILECAGCGGARWKGDTECPICHTKAVKIRRE